jgi:hypothetical protein
MARLASRAGPYKDESSNEARPSEGTRERAFVVIFRGQLEFAMFAKSSADSVYFGNQLRSLFYVGLT